MKKRTAGVVGSYAFGILLLVFGAICYLAERG